MLAFRESARELARRYGVEYVFDDDGCDECLSLVDAVYIALPNSLHAEYTTVRAGNIRTKRGPAASNGWLRGASV